MRAKPETTSRILVAIERVAASGREPSMRNVRARMMRDSRTETGASFEQILPLLRQWQAQQLERARVRIDAAVDAIVALRSRLERDEVRRGVEARTAGGIRVRFTAKGKPRKPVAASSDGAAAKTRAATPATGSRS